MISMITATKALGIGAAMTLTAATTTLLTQKDFTSIPPDSATVFATMDEMSITLSDATHNAEETVKGHATSAVAAVSGDGKTVSSFIVNVYAEDGHHIIAVSPDDGSVLEDIIVSRFPGVEVEGDWIETKSGLKYYDIVVGDGEQPANSSTKVEVHYSGWLNDGTKFDSSYDRHKTITFALDGVIKGWTEGVGSMRVGGTRKLIIPYDLAYGARGRGPTIPPKATLIFDVELISLPE